MEALPGARGQQDCGYEMGQSNGGKLVWGLGEKLMLSRGVETKLDNEDVKWCEQFVRSIDSEKRRVKQRGIKRQDFKKASQAPNNDFFSCPFASV